MASAPNSTRATLARATSTRATSTRATLARAAKLALVAAVVSAETSFVMAAGASFNLGEHYSYFTTLSNVFAGLVTAWALIGRASGVLRGAALTSLALTGLVVIALLGGTEIGQDPYGAIVMHTVTPLLALADWFLDPPKPRLASSAVWWWTLVPLVYLLYTLTRGAILDWYPYPFLDVAVHGYPRVLITCLIISAAFIGASFAIRWIGNRLRPAG